MTKPPSLPASRFWPKVQKTDSCWLWTGYRDPHGYGRFRVGEVSTFAHRWVYEQASGPIPDDLTLDHLCRVRHCVRPSHLEPVTGRENTLRGEGFSAVNARKVRCPAGHLYDDANTYVREQGARACRVCHREAQRKRQRAKRGPALQVALKDRTHCPKGHPYDEANTYRTPKGYRNCRACHREREATRKEIRYERS